MNFEVHIPIVNPPKHITEYAEGTLFLDKYDEVCIFLGEAQRPPSRHVHRNMVGMKRYDVLIMVKGKPKTIKVGSCNLNDLFKSVLPEGSSITFKQPLNTDY